MLSERHAERFQRMKSIQTMTVWCFATCFHPTLSKAKEGEPTTPLLFVSLKMWWQWFALRLGMTFVSFLLAWLSCRVYSVITKTCTPHLRLPSCNTLNYFLMLFKYSVCFCIYNFNKEINSI